jgi:hypothetical protein
VAFKRKRRWKPELTFSRQRKNTVVEFQENGLIRRKKTSPYLFSDSKATGICGGANRKNQQYRNKKNSPYTFHLSAPEVSNFKRYRAFPA